MTDKPWAAYERDLLLEGRWAPVTLCLLFVRATPNRAIDAVTRSPKARRILARTGVPLRRRPVAEPSLERVLASLLPLESPSGRRKVFLPTRNPEWCVMFGNYLRGLDPNGLMRDLARDGLDSVSIIDTPHTPTGPPKGTYGGRIIAMEEVIRPGESIGYLLGVRAASDRKWEMDLSATEFPGGNVWAPKAARVRDRFSHEHLVEMARRIGLHPFEEDFYVPQRGAVILEDTTLMPGRWLFTTLAQARGELPMPDHVLVGS